MNESDTLRLLHELQVHQVELELQNEELRDTRAALEVSLARQKELFDFAPVGYFVLDGAGAIVDLNFAGARLLGANRADVTGRPFAEFVVPEGREALGRVVTEAVAAAEDEGGHSVELVLLGARHRVPVKLTVTCSAGKRTQLLVAAEDVEERQHAEEGLREEVQRRDDFLATLSHELRNPLAPIRNGLHLLHLAPPSGERSRKALEVMDRQVRYLTRIVDDLLDVTRIARGKVVLQLKVEDLGELVRRTHEDHVQAFAAGGVELRCTVPPEPCWARVDGTRVVQVLGNLLSNALKFTRRGGRVELELRREGDLQLLRVRDDGAGIAPGVIDHLFHPFSQGPQGLARSAGGLGLGLATVRGLVELHHGEVGISSPGLGCGTEVVVRLPSSPAPEAWGLAPRPVRGQAHRVLVIDDNLDAATTLRELLEASGHTVWAAFDATTGLEAARAFQPEVVLCDIGLPDADGYSVARALRADGALRGAFLVAVSGYARPDDVRRSLEAGFDRHLAKPASLERLDAVIAEAPRPPEPHPLP
ncbi:MAG: ATP-binding protein [Anaeromyxobacteraceae bacterium]